MSPTPPRGPREDLGAWYRAQVFPRLTAAIVFDGVRLRGSSRERRAACPLHGGDNRNALAVNVHSLVWHCLTGCAAGGDALDWIAARNGLIRPGEKPRGAHFREAVRLAAALVGLTPPDARPLPAAERREAAQRLAAAEAARAEAEAAEAAAAATKVDVARGLWDAAEADSPVLSRYLASRRCWPPRDVAERCGLPLAPPRVRYATREAIAGATGLLTRDGTGWRLPDDAAGAALYAYVPLEHGHVVALQLDALTASGCRPTERWRRGIGSRGGGAVFRVRGRCPDGWTAICEGEVTAIAIAAAAHDVGDVRAVGGADLLTPEAAAGADRVWIVCDADAPNRRGVRPGPRAAHELAGELKAAGRSVRVSPAAGRHGEDYADTLSAYVDGITSALAGGGLDSSAALEAAWLQVARGAVCAVCAGSLAGGPFCPDCGSPTSPADQAALAVEATQ